MKVFNDFQLGLIERIEKAAEGRRYGLEIVDSKWQKSEAEQNAAYAMRQTIKTKGPFKPDRHKVPFLHEGDDLIYFEEGGERFAMATEKFLLYMASEICGDRAS